MLNAETRKAIEPQVRDLIRLVNNAQVEAKKLADMVIERDGNVQFESPVLDALTQIERTLGGMLPTITGRFG